MFCIKFILLVLWEKLMKANSGTSILESVSVAVTQTWATVLVARVTAWEPRPPAPPRLAPVPGGGVSRTGSSPCWSPLPAAQSGTPRCVAPTFVFWERRYSGAPLGWAGKASFSDTTSGPGRPLCAAQGWAAALGSALCPRSEPACCLFPVRWGQGPQSVASWLRSDLMFQNLLRILGAYSSWVTVTKASHLSSETGG